MARPNFGYLVRAVPVGPSSAHLYSPKVLRELPLLQSEYTHDDILKAMKNVGVPINQMEELITAMRIRGELEERGRSSERHYVVPTITKLKTTFSRLF
jgi:hypothetical protein